MPAQTKRWLVDQNILGSYGNYGSACNKPVAPHPPGDSAVRGLVTARVLYKRACNEEYACLAVCTVQQYAACRLVSEVNKAASLQHASRLIRRRWTPHH